ncbi:MAG: hypothetical protein JRF63_04870 [Deltaproteobacteria bacterium]|nr:hypothetical protein [Deltaproteobacteria bacterium]
MKSTKPRYAAALDRIIEKYTATPKDDPEFVDYTARPENKRSRRCPAARRRTTACASRRAR